MTDNQGYNIFEAKRKIKQFIMAVVFLAIIIGGWFYPLLGYFIPFCMLFGVTIGFFRGRKWCDWFCPRGSFYDAFLHPLSPRKEIPPFFRSRGTRLAVLSLLMLVMLVNLAARWPDPYKIGSFFVLLLTLTTILGIILALGFHQRFWCAVCPIGSIINWTGRNHPPLKINPELCVECKFCSKVCPMQIKPHLFKPEGANIVKDNDCLKCGLCIAVCPKKALHHDEAE